MAAGPTPNGVAADGWPGAHAVFPAQVDAAFPLGPPAGFARVGLWIAVSVVVALAIAGAILAGFDIVPGV